MYTAWENYGDSIYETNNINEAIKWLELSNSEIEELNQTIIHSNKNYVDFGCGNGIEWEIKN